MLTIPFDVRTHIHEVHILIGHTFGNLIEEEMGFA
jgi:hypothetical protein